MDSQAIQQIKARLNIADIIRRYVDLRPVSGRWMGVCPFHQETKPSMSVNEEEGFFYCFGCQASGDVIDFYQRINGLEFKEALELLADEASVELKKVKYDPNAQLERKKKKTILDMHDQAQAFFKWNLNQTHGAPASKYLKNRGLNPEIVDSFGLGYSLDDWHGLENFLKSKGWQPEDGVEAGLLTKNEKQNIYDRFRGRLIFPIHNLSGRVVAFGGRIISDGEPKYLNSSDTPIYKKGDHLYGLYQARSYMTRSKRALLTEGYMDVLSLHQFGYADSCGVLGTALTPTQVKRLGGFCDRIFLVFDGDGPGRKAALKSAEMIMLQGISCKVIMLPDGEDVDSLLQTSGTQGFDEFLNNSAKGLDYCLDLLKDEFSPKARMNWVENFINKIDDLKIRADYIAEISKKLGLIGVSETEFRRALGQSTPRTAAKNSHAIGEQTSQLDKDDKDDRYFLKFPIKHPEYISSLEERGFEQILVTDWAKNFWKKIVAHKNEDLLPWLNDNEKSFWTASREEKNRIVLSGQELSEEWEHILNKIASGRSKNSRTRLKAALQRAQEAGDTKRVLEYMKALSDSFGRDDEQH